MDAYTDFASVYDKFMEETPYDEWCESIKNILVANGITDGLVLDLGAGTGEMTRRLRDLGFDMIGVDNSEEMLMIAKNKEEGKEDILYLCQDMREFELYGTVRAVVSVCDCVNYILDGKELTEVFKLVNNYLDPKGLFVFDFNTKYKYRDVIGECTIAENREDASFIWENYYDEDTDINEYDITFFVKEGELFRRFTETHYQRGYTLDEIKKMLLKAGLEFVNAVDSESGQPANELSERILVTARECGK